MDRQTNKAATICSSFGEHKNQAKLEGLVPRVVVGKV
jgi:hypothetical protein